MNLNYKKISSIKIIAIFDFEIIFHAIFSIGSII